MRGCSCEPMPTAVTDELAREFRQVLGDEFKAPLEHFAARHAGTKAHTQFQLRSLSRFHISWCCGLVCQ